MSIIKEKVKTKINNLDKQFLQPNAQVSNIKNVDPSLIAEITALAKEDFARSFQFSNLFIQDEKPLGIMQIIPVVGGIISLVTLIIVIAK